MHLLIPVDQIDADADVLVLLLALALSLRPPALLLGLLHISLLGGFSNDFSGGLLLEDEPRSGMFS